MPDSRFFTRTEPLSLDKVSALIEVKIPTGVDSTRMVTDVARLEDAAATEIALFHNMKYIDALKTTKAGYVILEEKHLDKVPSTCIPLVSTSPHRSFAKLAQAFYPAEPIVPGIHPTAIIDSSAKVGKGCEVGPYVVIAANVEIGEGTQIAAQTSIGRGVYIGKNCRIAEQVTLTHTIIGDNVSIATGVRIGQSGFGFHMDESGHISIPHVGRVLIGNGADIGANTTIDRASMGDTVIGQGSRIDNLVMIGHGVELGRGCVLVAQVGIAGSTKLGDYAVAAGQAGIAGHLTIGKGAKIAARAGLMRDVEDNGIVAGTPAVPFKEWQKQVVILEHLSKNFKEITKITKALKESA